jgi:hypothetical protein
LPIACSLKTVIPVGAMMMEPVIFAPEKFVYQNYLTKSLLKKKNQRLLDKNLRQGLC